MRTKPIIISILLAFFIALSGISAQETSPVMNTRPSFPYTLDWGMDGALAAADLGLFGSSVYLQSVKALRIPGTWIPQNPFLIFCTPPTIP